MAAAAACSCPSPPRLLGLRRPLPRPRDRAPLRRHPRVRDSGGARSSGPSSDSDAVSLAMALHPADSASLDLTRFHDALSFLSRSLRLLTPLLPTKDAAVGDEGGDSDAEGSDVRPEAHAVRLQLANVNTALGRREEALTDLRASVELKELIPPPGSQELGAAYWDLAEAHASVLDFKQALPFCQKALELHESTLGKNSVELAHDRRLLGVIYTSLEQHEQALEENEMSQKVMKKWGVAGADLIHAEMSGHPCRTPPAHRAWERSRPSLKFLADCSTVLSGNPTYSHLIHVNFGGKPTFSTSKCVGT